VDFDALIRTGRWPDFEPTSTVLLEVVDTAVRTRRPGTVRIVDYHNTQVTLEADSPDGGWVVLNDIWQPWWFATIDGRSAPILQANVLFRAVEVPAGRHTIVFRFLPLSGAWQQVKARLSL
jgi:uncharacterized membrane protein YfhO